MLGLVVLILIEQRRPDCRLVLDEIEASLGAFLIEPCKFLERVRPIHKTVSCSRITNLSARLRVRQQHCANYRLFFEVGNLYRFPIEKPLQVAGVAFHLTKWTPPRFPTCL